MAKKDELCSDAKRLLVDGIPLRTLKDNTRYFLYPMNKSDYSIVKKAIDELREKIAHTTYDNAKIYRSEFVHKWGFDPFTEGAFMGSTDIKSEEDYDIVRNLFEVVQVKNKSHNVQSGSYQCFCHKNFKSNIYVPHRTIKDSWECMLIAYNNPTHAIVLSHKVDKDGFRIWE